MTLKARIKRIERQNKQPEENNYNVRLFDGIDTVKEKLKQGITIKQLREHSEGRLFTFDDMFSQKELEGLTRGN